MRRGILEVGVSEFYPIPIVEKGRGLSSPLPRNLETPYEALRAPVRDSPHETAFGLNLTPKRATALEFEPLRATVVQGPFHRCATTGDTMAEQGRGTLVGPEISYAGNAPHFRYCSSLVRQAPVCLCAGCTGG